MEPTCLATHEPLHLAGEINQGAPLAGVICADPHMEEVWDLVRRVADSQSTVLITGPSGTGKELVARNLHELGSRRRERLVSVNCAAIPRELMESEFFGHERGAFTGACERRIGRFEFASKGTIFLDEVGSLSGELQAKLLRVLQEQELTRVGAVEPIRIDTRVVAATNDDLQSRVRRGTFREDLFYRLNVLPIKLPPLCERPADILPIARHMLRRQKGRFDEGLELDLEAEAVLRSYRWPGNVRELGNVVERMAVLARGRILSVADIPRELLPLPRQPDGLFRAARANFDRWLIERALERCEWRVKEAADVLGLHRNTLHQKMEVLGIRRPGGDTDEEEGSR